MKTTPKENKLARILKTYSILNATVGLLQSLFLWFSTSIDYFFEAFASFAEVLVASVAIYALGEIIQLLHGIYLNTCKEEVAPDELPDL